MPQLVDDTPWTQGSARWLTGLSILLGIVHTWAGRYSMSPDGVSYIDVGRAFFRHDWYGAFNAYWSPLYAWVLGTILGLVHASLRLEYPAAHVVNFFVFLASLAAFRFLLRSALDCRKTHALAAGRSTLPEWAVNLIAYPLFWWACFELMPLYEVGPDLAISTCLYLALGFLLRARTRTSVLDFLLFGFSLGLGYWVKAPFFLLSFVILLVAYLWGRPTPKWSTGIGYGALAFLVTAAPLILALSLQKHRPTFGDSGRLNYAWFIAPQTFHRNWQGREPGSGIPVHPTRQVFSDPPAYPFPGPVVCTYPPWLNPSYFNEGLRPRFDLKAQLRELLTDLMTEASLVLRAQPALLLAVVLLLALGGSPALADLKYFWPLPAIALAAFAMYAPVHVEPRFLGGFVVILFLTPVIAASVPSDDLRAARSLAIVLFAVMLIVAIDTAYRFTTLHLAIPGNGPMPALEHVVVANQLQAMGLAPGDPVAIIGDGTGAYWANLAHLRIVAEVMGAEHNAQRFWQSPPATRTAVLQKFQEAGARLALAENPPENSREGWTRIANTSWYVFPLTHPPVQATPEAPQGRPR